MKNRRLLKKMMIALIGLTSLSNVASGYLAFPNAEGFGALSKGGRGGDVYHVTNLDDSGLGSLRYGIENTNGPRTIVFDVSGTIYLESSIRVRDDVTIAGQTAPGDGICLAGDSLKISGKNVIVRFIRSRPGYNTGGDAIWIQGGTNIIVDHCSATWSVDEALSCSSTSLGDVTVQWCIIAEALDEGGHNKGAHSYGSLIKGSYGARYSFHHNLYAHNNSRNPRVGNNRSKQDDPHGLDFDFRNNVLYNCGGRHGYSTRFEEQEIDLEYPDGVIRETKVSALTDGIMDMHFVDNYYLPGPDTETDLMFRAGSINERSFFSGNYWGGSLLSNPYSKIDYGDKHKYKSYEIQIEWDGNELEDYETVSLEDYNEAEFEDIINYFQSDKYVFSVPNMKEKSAVDAYNDVITHVGASLFRDSVDARIINDVVNGTGQIIDNQSEVGGYPVLQSELPMSDIDQDGMPDLWEDDNGLNKYDSSDRNHENFPTVYTNLEVYLNDLVCHLWGDSPISDMSSIRDDSIAWTELIYEDFESGFGMFSDGGRDCKLSQVFALGENCVNLQDDTPSSKVTLSQPLDLSHSSEINVEFSFYAKRLINGHYLSLEYSDDNGQSWNEIIRYVMGEDFGNDQRYFESVIVTDSVVSFVEQSKIRFILNTRKNRHDVYIDDVKISAKLGDLVNQ